MKKPLGLISCVATLLGADTVHAQEAVRTALKEIHPRLKSIYEAGAFRARRFQGVWLPDSSGYRVRGQRGKGEGGAAWYGYDVVTGERTEWAPSRQGHGMNGETLSPDGRRRLVSRGGHLSIRDLMTGESIDIGDQGEGISTGRASWSPDGRRIVFVQSDQSRVRLRSMLIPGEPSYPTLKETRFARVGGSIAQLKVGVADAGSGEVLWLPVRAPEEGFYLGQVGWAENSHEVLVEKLSRFRDQREFLLVDLDSGSVTPVFRESDPAWVVASYRKNVGLEWLDDGRAFMVITEKDGWRHAYRYSREGKEERLLTPGNYDIIERAKVDHTGGWFYFYASPENGTQKYLFRTPLDGRGRPERVTPEGQAGTHDYVISPDSKWAFPTYSRFDAPPVTDLVALEEHRVVRGLENNRAIRERMEGLIERPTEFFELEIANGVVMDAWMLKPSGFDPRRRYPVLVYVYGEPHVQTVVDAWGKVHAQFHRAVADLGYLVVSIDNRGTPAPKGAAWRRAVFGSLGPLSTREQAQGVKELARRFSFADVDRIGIWGWSGGGSNTLNAMFREPGVYRMGIAVAPKPQPHLYNAWFQEIYMETRETNVDGYRRSAPLNFAEGLQGDLLIVHGSGETNTHLEIVEGLVDRLIELGKPVDYMVYPNRNHGIREGKGTSVHLRMHMVRYLLEHLSPGPRP